VNFLHVTCRDPRIESSVRDEEHNAVNMALTRWFIDTRPLWPDEQDVTPFAAMLTILLASQVALVTS